MSTPTEVAGRYRLERRLGAGGMSTVFLAQDAVLERPVAVKLLAEHLAEDEAFVMRFRHEALAAARLQHPNIVQVFDSGMDADSERHYIVMEYVDGPSAADLMRQKQMLDVDETVRIVRDACHGLDYAHRAGVVHRDVKPGNLLISDETGGVKLADFGIAKAAEQTRITQVGSVLGTAAYLSPEQAGGQEAQPASDIYSLGVCTDQFLTGRLPHEYGSLTELALKQQNEAVQPIVDFRPEVPPELDRAVRITLERDEHMRYSTALEFAMALEAGLHGEDTAATQAFSQGGWDTDATQALPAGTAATRVAPRTAPPMVPPATRAPSRRDEPAQPRKKRSPARAIAIGLILLLAGIALALALTLPGSGGSQRIQKGDVPSQADALIQYVRQHQK
jgi:serine/threonine-protein kinase